METMTMEQAVEAVKASNTELITKATEKTEKEIQKMAIELKAAQDKIEELKTDAATKGATILDLQTIQKDANARNARTVQSGKESSSGLVKSLSDLIWKNKDVFEKAAETGLKMEDLNFKASNVSSSSMSAGSASPYATFLPWQPGMEPIGQFRIRSLVSTIQSDFDVVYFPRANSPVGAGSFSRQTTEGNAKDQVDRGWTMNKVTCTAFAAYLIASRQSLRNIPFMQTWLPTSLNEQLLDAEDLDYANQLVAGATGSASTTGAGSVAIEQVIFLLKNLIKAKFYPTAVAIDPDKWASMLITKPSNYSLPNAVVIGTDGMVRILGRPVYPANWLTGGRTLIGDFTKASIIESESLSLRQTDSHASTFIANQVTFLLERTEQLAIFRPDAFNTAILS
jgi:HK97 family phage major capsid protein